MPIGLVEILLIVLINVLILIPVVLLCTVLYKLIQVLNRLTEKEESHSLHSERHSKS